MSTAVSQFAFKGIAGMVIMGVAGCGKSTIGPLLAERIDAVYQDADHLHAAESIAKMKTGIPLTDEDRWPWLERAGKLLAGDGQKLIIGCSALKRIYRNRLRETAGGDILFIHLVGSKEVIAGRMADRDGHFMPLALLDSQFATLEPPEQDETSLSVDIEQPAETVIADLIRQLKDTENGR